jgi:hypothetical protein
MWICEVAFSIGEDPGARRLERTKTIYGRISWCHPTHMRVARDLRRGVIQGAAQPLPWRGRHAVYGPQRETAPCAARPWPHHVQSCAAAR